MISRAFIFTLMVLSLSCNNRNDSKMMKQGEWIGVLTLVGRPAETPKELIPEVEHILLPFNFHFSFAQEKPLITIRNAEEKIEVEEIQIKGDSINFQMPVFDSEFKCRIINDTVLEGVWINHARKNKNILPFAAYFGSQRFVPTGVPHADYSGKWEVTFSPNTPDSSKAMGEFVQEKGKVTGTFLTETGDYRFLEGMADANGLMLSAFDGSHAFLFSARGDGNMLKGGFWSGAHWHEPWEAKRNEAFQLAHPDSLTFIKDPGNIDFTFPDLQGKPVSLSDYKGKPVIVQIMGSWCPNCMDETKLLSELYDEYHSKGLEIVALAYEKSKDFESAARTALRLKERYGIRYPVLITGKTGKEEASESLPFLSGILAFPTTVYIDKKGNVKKVQTGFSGPGTGAHYEKQVKKIRLTIEELLED